MGLCKCPKRKVTNQFCFEHRVNVCEHCMVTNHPKCVIQSYLQWLQDSDCNPICTFCNETLSSRECCRLTCYHVYHWACLDSHCRSLPDSKNASSYLCPMCNTRIVPQPNLVSPVADVLREKLGGVNWARAILGLPLLSSDSEAKPDQTRSVLESEEGQPSIYQNHVIPSSATSRTSSVVTSSNSIPNNSNSNNQKLGPPYSVVNMESSTSNPRRVFEAYDSKDSLFDHDENKYQRKSAMEWFLRWWKLITRSHAQRRSSPRSLYKAYATLIIVSIVVFIFIMMLMSKLGRMATDGDPSYDPMNNPMININDNSDQTN